MKTNGAICVADKRVTDVVGSDDRHMHNADFAAAFYESEDRALLLAYVALETGLALSRSRGNGRFNLAEIGFVGFNHFARAAERVLVLL